MVPIPKVSLPTEKSDVLTLFLSRRPIKSPVIISLRQSMTSLVKVSDDIRLNLESNQPMIFVSFDFSKVFDSVCHEMFIFKLRQRYDFHICFIFYFSFASKGRLW
jgi:hypothetical protein